MVFGGTSQVNVCQNATIMQGVSQFAYWNHGSNMLLMWDAGMWMTRKQWQRHSGKPGRLLLPYWIDFRATRMQWSGSRVLQDMLCGGPAKLGQFSCLCCSHRCLDNLRGYSIPACYMWPASSLRSSAMIPTKMLPWVSPASKQGHPVDDIITYHQLINRHLEQCVNVLV